MAKRKVKVGDQYANKAGVTISMEAANTLTFTQVRFSVGLFQGMGLVLHEVTFEFAKGTLREVVAATDLCEVALTTSNAITDLDPTQDQVIDRFRLVGVGANVESVAQPYRREFSNLPNGGLILAANPLFVAMTTEGFAAAGGATVLLRYSFKELSDRDYLEILQSTRSANI